MLKENRQETMQPEDFREQTKISDAQFQQFQTYHKALLKWQKAINLVSNTTLQSAWERHFWDSAQLVPYIPEQVKTIVDLGSGAGFPGMVLALLFPDKNIHMIESDERKCQFLKHVSRETNRPVSIHDDRIENIIQNLTPDIITARAFSSLENIIKMTKSVWQKNPALKMLLLKGQKVEQEMAEARQLYAFDYEAHDSETHSEGCILKISNIKDAG